MLDNFDKKIVTILQRNARTSVEKIAALVNLSPTPVRRRIKHLEEKGYIRAYTIELDMKKMGYELEMLVFIKLNQRSKDVIDDFEAKIHTFQEVVSCRLITGSYDYVLQIHVADMEGYSYLLHNKLANIAGVTGIETSVVIAKVK